MDDSAQGIALRSDWKESVKAYRQSASVLGSSQQVLEGDATLAAALAKANEAAFSNDAPPSDDAPGPSFLDLLPEELKASPLETLAGPGADATELLSLLRSGKVSALDATNAFLARAQLAHRATGCLTSLFSDAACKRAVELDEIRLSDPKAMGLLHGLPISIKAHIGLVGSRSDRGILFDVLNPQAVEELLKDGGEVANSVSPAILEAMRTQGPHLQVADAVIVRQLKALGAVIIAKTTMPQTIMALATRSNVHGVTLNPHNLHLSPGGSSGGEAALVACGGSAAGIGTDIGGSVRQPATCTGLYGLRATTGRLSAVGLRSAMVGNEGILGTSGVFTTTLRDMKLMMSSFCSASSEVAPWKLDPHGCPFVPWREVPDARAADKPLRIGILHNDGYVQPTAPVRRTLHEQVAKLRSYAAKQGQGKLELVDLDIGEMGGEGWDLARELYFLDGGELMQALINSTGEPTLPLTKFILSSPTRVHTVNEVWRLVGRKGAFQRKFMDLWREKKIDVLLCPAAPLPAPRPDRIRYWGYTSLFNLLDLPSIAFPAPARANAEADSAWESATEAQAWSAAPNEFDTEIRQEYEQHRKVFDNAPVGLQLVGERWHEEELLAALKLIETATTSPV